MKKIKWITLIVTLLLVSPCVDAEFFSDEKETLRGIKCVLVYVDALNPDAIKHGLTKEAIKTDVELKLRLAGIKVLTSKERLNTPGMPCLYVNVNLILSGSYFIYSIRLLLDQEVYLARDTKISTMAATWNTSMAGGVDSNRMSKVIREKVKYLVDIFLNDYLAVNPIQPSKQKGK